MILINVSIMYFYKYIYRITKLLTIFFGKTSGYVYMDCKIQNSIAVLQP